MNSDIATMEEDVLDLDRNDCAKKYVCYVNSNSAILEARSG